jgi:hypothetical protein
LHTRSPVVLNVVCGHGGVGDAVIDDGVNADCHRVPGQDFLRRNVEGHSPQVHLLVAIGTGNDEEDSWSLGATFYIKSLILNSIGSE